MLLGLDPQVQPDSARSLALVRTARLESDLDVQGLVARILREHGRHADRHLAFVDEELLLQPLDPERVRGRQRRLPDLQPLDWGHGHRNSPGYGTPQKRSSRFVTPKAA